MDLLTEYARDDALSELLRDIRVRSTVWCRSEMSAPWGFAVQPREAASFHLVVEGECWAEVEGVDEPLRLGQGDLVILPTGRGHTVRDDPASRVTLLETILETVPLQNGHMRYGGSGPRTELVCGGFSIEDGSAHPLLASMPPVLLVQGSDGQPAEWLRSTLELLRGEMSSTAPGSEAFVSRLTDVLLTQALRVSLANRDGRVGPIRDRQVSEALRLVHQDPAHPWTVSQLAGKVALSRSAFSTRFRSVTGESPMRYVTRTRLAKAARLLRSTDASVSQISGEVGYESEASLTRAFKREYDLPPATYRREPGS